MSMTFFNRNRREQAARELERATAEPEKKSKKEVRANESPAKNMVDAKAPH